jgi:dolichol-phosphate mannosyltransferase
MASVSVLMPAFNEGEGLTLAVQEVEKRLAPLGHELHFILIDDGSVDRTWEVIERLAAGHPRLTGLRLSRNFGKEAALFAGLDVVATDCVIVMDADLQHPPDVLPEMLRRWQDGYQIVHGVKRQRQGESLFRRACSRLIFGLAKTMSGLELQRSSDFKVLDREVVRRYREFRERQVFFRGLIDWLGFRSTTVSFDVAERAMGQSAFSLWGLLSYAAHAIISFSALPLKIVSTLALIFFVLSSFFLLKTWYDWATAHSAEGFPTVITLIVAFGNFTLIAVSVISWYVGKIFEEIKMRPRYVVAQSVVEKANPG